MTQLFPKVVVVVAVRNKVRLSYISRTVCSKITTFYVKIHNRRAYNHTGYDVTTYFRSAVIDVRKRAENDAFGGFNLESAKLAHTFILVS